MSEPIFSVLFSSWSKTMLIACSVRVNEGAFWEASKVPLGTEPSTLLCLCPYCQPTFWVSPFMTPSSRFPCLRQSRAAGTVFTPRVNMPPARGCLDETTWSYLEGHLVLHVNTVFLSSARPAFTNSQTLANVKPHIPGSRKVHSPGKLGLPLPNWSNTVGSKCTWLKKMEYISGLPEKKYM